MPQVQKPKLTKTLPKAPSQLKPNKDIPQVITIDATGKILGRLATEVSIVLRGKNKPDFVPYKSNDQKVIVTNAEKIKVTGNKMAQKIYYHHTGYIGHLKQESLKDVFTKDPTEVILRAVTGMLPKNKLRNVWLSNLEIRKGQ